MDPASRFAALVAGPPSELALDRACALMAAAFTGVDRTDDVRRRLDDLAEMVVDRSLTGVLAVMRGRLVGNRADYHDPRNSFIDDVLTRGLGLPITLSVVAIEVGRRLDVPVAGVGLPSHFVVREGTRELYGDPFNDGALYDRAGLVAVWQRLVGEGHPFDELHLLPVGERAILIRMLNNLRAVSARAADPRHLPALAVMRGAFVELAHEAPEHARWVRHLN
jgi:regulator of sirC expression with transglutaminase-like and TPR domain